MKSILLKTFCQPLFRHQLNLEDFIHDCAVRLDGFLRAKGIEVIQKSWGDEKHPEPHVFLINQKDELAKEANDEEAEFFRKHLVKD